MSNINKLLAESFSPEFEYFTRGFNEVSSHLFDISAYIKRDTESFKLVFNKLLYDCNNFLDKQMKLLCVLDNASRSDGEWPIVSSLTTEEKINFLMEKLYLLYGEEWYPIKYIFIGNGILVKRAGEYVELGKIIVDKGWAKPQPGSNSNAMLRLTAQGVNYVEQKLHKPKRTRGSRSKSAHSKTDSRLDDLNKKIDAIIEDLKLKGYGQEILFEELQDLKEQAPKLGVKQFGQLLKGKLFDLGLDSVINKETIASVYKNLTEQVFHLP